MPKVVKTYVLWETSVAGFPVKLMKQARPYRYTVVYGKQERSSLTYANAALELGLALMHGLNSEGKLDADRRDP